MSKFVFDLREDPPSDYELQVLAFHAAQQQFKPYLDEHYREQAHRVQQWRIRCKEADQTKATHPPFPLPDTKYLRPLFDRLLVDAANLVIQAMGLNFR